MQETPNYSHPFCPWAEVYFWMQLTDSFWQNQPRNLITIPALQETDKPAKLYQSTSYPSSAICLTGVYAGYFVNVEPPRIRLARVIEESGAAFNLEEARKRLRKHIDCPVIPQLIKIIQDQQPAVYPRLMIAAFQALDYPISARTFLANIQTTSAFRQLHRPQFSLFPRHPQINPTL